MLPYPLKNKRIWVAGHNGMVGSAIMRRLEGEGCIILNASRAALDLTRQDQVEAWMTQHKPHAVFLAAAKVGGILANSRYPADFLYDNLMIESNVIHAAYKAGVEKLLFLGSSCIYPRNAPQPLKEDYLLGGTPEPTNEAYAIAKIAGLKLCEAYRRQYGCDFISLMPTNLYGPGDDYHPEHAHVPAALLRRFHEAKISGAPQVAIWGTGTPLREFMYVDDLADACIFAIKNYSDAGFLNVGSGQEISINDFAALIAKIVGYEGGIVHDPEKPDGMPRKFLDSSKIRALGWQAHHALEDGLSMTYHDFCSTQSGV